MFEKSRLFHRVHNYTFQHVMCVQVSFAARFFLFIFSSITPIPFHFRRTLPTVLLLLYIWTIFRYTTRCRRLMRLVLLNNTLASVCNWLYVLWWNWTHLKSEKSVYLLFLACLEFKKKWTDPRENLFSSQFNAYRRNNTQTQQTCQT